METQKKVAHQVGGIQNDALRFGLHGIKSGILDSHPLETAYHSARKGEEEMKRAIVANTYGSAFPIKTDLDRQILSRFHRPTGAIPSSMLGLDALTGTLDDLGFADFLNDHGEKGSGVCEDMHHGMEVQHGISSGPVSRAFF